MKHQVFYILAVLVMITTFSCKKANRAGNEGIVGKWELKEIYLGYANGGNFKWNPVSIDDSHILTFSKNGQYYRKEYRNGNNQECIGTFNIEPSYILEVNSGCYTTTEKMHVSELTTTLLIIDYSVMEGKIRYKYAAIK